MENTIALDGETGDQTLNEANLDWLSELDERANANRGMDEIMAESENEREYDIDADVLVGLSETKRGPTMLHKVHMRSFEKREAIILNEFGHPIGPITPEKDTVDEFSQFLGTIARDYGTAPLLHRTWKLVPCKEKMWEYVLTKYIIAEQGREWVLKTIGAAWRIHKCRFKKKHYYRYSNNKLRWLNRSKRVPDDDFKKLLILWNKKKEKKNEDPNKQLPSLAQLFERTRKRQENKRYADTYDDTARKIEAMKNYTPPEDGSGPKDPYLGVMGKEYTGRRRLYGRGMVMDALRADIQNEKTEIVDMRKELEADYERKKAELEANYAKKMEEFDKTKDKMVQDVLEKLISKLPTNVVGEFLT
ncbi:Alpha-amylase 1 [Bienertia sinuspersici]